jgi:pimeloyl-ACP methyl ester carboxylesterase
MNTTDSKKNTISHNRSQIPKSIILTGKFLQFISTKLVTKFAIKLFRTPIRFKTPEREKIMANNAKMQMVLIPSLNKEVAVYTYGNCKRKALLIHGWSGRGTQLYKIADKLLENGFMTISFDAPAHGKSTGKTTMMTEFIETTKILNEKFGPFEIAIGHSLGGMTVLNSVKQFLTVKKAVIIGSGDIITDIIINFINKLELNLKLVEKMKKIFFKKFNQDIDNFSASVAAKSVKIPTLVIHDSEDREVPVTCSYNIRENLEFGELIITNGLGHTRILKDTTVIKKIIEFISDDRKNN